jgi:hypothetical protein
MAEPGSRITDAERGIDERGLDRANIRIVEPPRIFASGPLRAADFAAQQAADAAEEEAKEAWKSEHPTWPFNASLRRQSGFIFSEEEITAEVMDYLGYVPGPVGLAATIISIAAAIKKAIESRDIGSMNHVTWSLVESIAVQVTLAVAKKKISIARARRMIAAILKKTGLDNAIAEEAARIVFEIHIIAGKEFKRLMQSKAFRALSASKKGTKWDEKVGALLELFNKEQAGKKSGFHFTFAMKHQENQLALGSGKYHDGPNVDLILHYNNTEVAYIDLKLSTKAVSPFRTQTFMLVEKSVDNDQLVIYMTPEQIVILPGIAGGVPVPVKLLRMG